MEHDTRVWEEQGLRAAILAGDEAAWRVLYERYFNALYAYVYCRCDRRPQRAEEVVQECWLTAIRRIRKFNPERGAFEGWLRGIAENHLRNHRRRWQRRDATEEGRSDLADVSDPVDTAANVEVGERIALALTTLPARYQAALQAKYEEQRSVADIAACWGVSLKAVESLLSRARTAFREAYARQDREA